MATYTDSLGLELITPGSQAGLWGNTTNNTFNLIDQAITGVTPVSFAGASGTTYTLTDFNGAADEARAAVLNVTGSATGSNTIVVPNKQKTYLVRNNTGQDVVFQTASPTATYTVGAGYSILIFCDGNNNVFTGIASPGVGTLSVNAGGTGTTSFVGGGFVKSSGGTNALTASATVNAATEISGVLPVTFGGTGQSSLTSGALLFGSGTGNVGSLVGGAIGHVPTWNGSGWTSSAPPGGVSSVSGTSPINVANGTTTPVVSLASSGVSPGSYTNANITVDSFGRVTGATNGTSAGITSISAGSGITVNGGTGPVTSGSVTIAATGGGMVYPAAGIPYSNGTSWGSSYNSAFPIPTAYGGTGNTTGTAADSSKLGGVSASSYVDVSSTQTISGSKTFSGTVISTSWNMNSNTRMYLNGTQIIWTHSSANVMLIDSSGNFRIFGSDAYKATGTTWINPSDARIKDNVQDYTKGLQELVQINPKTWTFNGKGGSSAGAKGLGVVADEVQTIIPDAVSTYKAKLNESDAEETDIKNFNADEIIWMLVNSVKELKAEVDALKAAK